MNKKENPVKINGIVQKKPWKYDISAWQIAIKWVLYKVVYKWIERV